MRPCPRMGTRQAIQAYFERGFPYGADQWISAAASAWAVTALASQNSDASPIVLKR